MRHFHVFLARGLDETSIPHAQLPFWHLSEANEVAKMLAESLFFPTKEPKARMYEPAIHEQTLRTRGDQLSHYIVGNKAVYVEECIAEGCSPDGFVEEEPDDAARG